LRDVEGEMKKEGVRPGTLDDFVEAVGRLVPDTQDESADVGDWTLDEPFDKQAFLERMLGDTQLAGEIAGLFLTQSRELIADMSKAVRKRDLQAVERGVQSLKGSVASFGASAVLDALRDLEKSAQAGEWDRTSAALQELGRHVKLLGQALEAVWGTKQIWRIVIADDDPVSRRLLQATLTKWGHEPFVCVDGAQALSVLQKPDAPKIAILDWMMPGLDGVQVCRELRAKAPARNVYVILLTGRDRTDDIIEGLDAGADDYLTKPFDPEELKGRLGVAFRTVETQSDEKAVHSAAVRPPQDPSTDLLSRGGILVLLKRHIIRAQREGKILGVILAQCEQYHEIEKSHGAATADALLKAVAHRVVSFMGSEDLAGRYDEDRMLILLPDKGRDEIIEFAQAVRTIVEAGPLSVRGQRVSAKLSIGVTVVTGQHGIAVESAIMAAEEALADARKNPAANVRFAAIKELPVVAPAIQPRKVSAASKLDLELIVAARAGNVKRVSGLLDSGADVEARDNRGNTALIESAFFKYPDLVKLLLDRGADINARNNSGDTALSEAVRAGHQDVVDLLLSRWNPSGLPEESAALYRALFEASSYGNTGVVTAVRDLLSRLSHGKQV